MRDPTRTSGPKPAGHYVRDAVTGLALLAAFVSPILAIVIYVAGGPWMTVLIVGMVLVALSLILEG